MQMDLFTCKPEKKILVSFMEIGGEKRKARNLFVHKRKVREGGASSG